MKYNEFHNRFDTISIKVFYNELFLLTVFLTVHFELFGDVESNTSIQKGVHKDIREKILMNFILK